ncbi:SIS domain-containing protein [Qipengyuania sp.]|uniref:SIS domain-containing protein n=1 Tax=Qipengyuania sp. TaxID=2004515 RepID=UPI0035C860ED
MSEPQSLMLQEAESAGTVVEGQIARNRSLMVDAAARLRRLDPPFALTIARGSSDHAANFAKLLFETRLGIPVVSQSPSLATLYGKVSPKVAGAFALAISQSGKSPDLIETAKAVRGQGAFLVAMVNDPASPLAEEADIVIPLHAGSERSVAATKSFIASLTAISDLAAHWGEDRGLARALGDAGALLDNAWAMDWSEAIEPLAAVRQVLVLGRGLTWPIAAEAALKFKETAQIHAESFSSAEVAHGPMALVGEGDPILAFAPADEAAQGFAERLAAFAERGAKVIAAGSEDTTAPAAIRLPIAGSKDPAVTSIGMIASFYRLAEALARRLGRDPDDPPFLSKVTRTR